MDGARQGRRGRWRNARGHPDIEHAVENVSLKALERFGLEL